MKQHWTLNSKEINCGNKLGFINNVQVNYSIISKYYIN